MFQHHIHYSITFLNANKYKLYFSLNSCASPEEIINRKSYSNIPLTSHSLFHTHIHGSYYYPDRDGNETIKRFKTRSRNTVPRQQVNKHGNTFTVYKLFKMSALSSSRSLKGVLQTATSHYFISLFSRSLPLSLSLRHFYLEVSRHPVSLAHCEVSKTPDAVQKKKSSKCRTQTCVSFSCVFWLC